MMHKAKKEVDVHHACGSSLAARPDSAHAPADG